MPETARIKHCIELFKGCRHLDGDVAECGVAFGHLTFILDTFVLAAGKALLAFDTYSGMPYDDAANSDDPCLAGEMDYGKDFFQVYDQLENSSIIPVRGLVEKTLVQHASKKFCFVWLDMDAYQPTAHAYSFFEDRMVNGGIIGFHDYGFSRCPGVEIVVNDEVDPTKYETVLNQDTCYFIRRREND